ncbi:DUF1893 domain-containing protein [Papillibacter cinnamivorans]|uniref:DUF1893 domain-containing protein n=1 Tax=Papillibacter cinnamivorans DSM 12816 TaxID=1122930 RepID=A0A1W2CL67_9FIRM|nr:DUF1893 domain-containing protein [Papillibacter cinnamivorans]SMC85734.1 protein of unknown function [Papillibacter cinnamivorans DSM 12816]
MRDIDKAKQLLSQGGYTCVLCRGGTVYTSTLRGVTPVVEWLDAGTDLRGFSAADKVIGKAAAMLFVLAGVGEVYAPVMTGTAKDILTHRGIRNSCDTITGSIINRAGTGPCPMERAVKEIEEPALALEAVKQTLLRLKNETQEAGN